MEVTEVALFYAPKMEKWVIRPFVGMYGFRVGDTLTDHEWTDDEIRATYGSCIITRGYAFAASATMSHIATYHSRT